MMLIGEGRSAFKGSQVCRVCSICLAWKPLEDFMKDKNRYSGFGWRCKICDSKKRLARYYAAKSKGEI